MHVYKHQKKKKKTLTHLCKINSFYEQNSNRFVYKLTTVKLFTILWYLYSEELVCRQIIVTCFAVFSSKIV